MGSTQTVVPPAPDVGERRNRYNLSNEVGYWIALRQRARRDAIRLGRAIIERLVFAHTFTPVARIGRWLVRAWWRSDLAKLDPVFEPDIYLMQVRSPVRRRRAAMDPLLHYRLLGWREHRTPVAAFDPTAFREAHSDHRGEPFIGAMGLGFPTRRRPSATASVAGASRPIVLVLRNARGGGSERFLRHYCAQSLRPGEVMQTLRPLSGAARVSTWDEHPSTPAFDLHDPHGRQRLAVAARAAGVARLIVNHVIDHEWSIFAALPALARDIGVPMTVLLHDYFAICPRVDGVQGNGRFCGFSNFADCGTCVATHGAEAGLVDPGRWRAEFQQFLSAADNVVTASQDLSDRLAPHLPGIRLQAWPVEDDLSHPPEQPPRLNVHEQLRLATLGALNVPKGVGVVLGLARQLRASPAPISLSCLGPSPYASDLERHGVSVTGRYRPADLPGLLAAQAPHAIFLPAVWPETWSFVLSEALDTGLPVIAFDHGAPAARLRALQRGHLLPLDLAHRPVDLLAALLGIAQQWRSP